MDSGHSGRNTGCSLKRCFGLCARAAHDVTCPLRLATRARHSAGSATGVKPTFSNAYSMPSVRTGHGIRHGGCHYRNGPPTRSGRKRGTQSQAIGRSKGGMTTKILAITDALGNLVRFELLPGHRFDAVGVAPLIDGIEFGALLAHKAFDSNNNVADLNERRENRHLATSASISAFANRH